MDGYNISGDFNSFEPGYAADVAEVSGFGASVKSYVVGLADPAIRIAGLFDDEANKAHDIATDRVGSEVMLSASWGTDVGKGGVSGTVSLSEYSVSSGISGPVSSAMSLSGGGGAGIFEFVRTLWGNVRFQGTVDAGFNTGDTPSNAGFSAHLQLIGGNGTIIVQSSTAAAAASVWTDRINFGSHSAPYAAYVGTYKGTAPAFLRVITTGVAVGTGWVGYKRF